MLNLKYKFKEGQLPKDFCKESAQKIKKLFDSNTTFTTVAMTSSGVSFLLRFLAMTYPAYFVFLDMYTLPKLKKEDFYKALLKELGGNASLEDTGKLFESCKDQLEIILKQQSKIVIVINRFDQLESEFDENLFANLRSLRNTDPHKITMVLTSIKPLHEIAQHALSGSNLNLLSKYVYLKPYSEDDLRMLIKYGVLTKVDKKDLPTLIQLSGGHGQLYQILARSENKGNLALDHFIKLQLKELYESLSYKRKKEIQNIALGKNLDNIDEYLLNIGMVKQNGNYQLFTPLLVEYVRSSLPLKLPAKEAKLFRLLRHNMGILVTKDHIFQTIWGESSDASDWALDALIYRLRKNPGFNSQGYQIENHKKLGYILVKD